MHSVQCTRHACARRSSALFLSTAALLGCLLGFANDRASAAVTITGDRDTSPPLVIDPSGDPVASPRVGLSPPQPTMFIQSMPVTKRVDSVTLGDIGLDPSCTTGASPWLTVYEHSDGNLFPRSAAPVFANSTSGQPLPATPGRVTWTIAPKTFRKGRGYSFAVGGGGGSGVCTKMRTVSWESGASQVNAGPALCTEAPLRQLLDGTMVPNKSKRMWHDWGVYDRQPACINGTTDSWFGSSMQTGWLVTHQYNGVNWYAATHAHASGVPADPYCAGDASRYLNFGTSEQFWRLTPNRTDGREDWACYWTRFGAPGEQVPNGWFYSEPWLQNNDSAPRTMYLKLDTIDYDALLQQHNPTWAFDLDENFYPQKASAFTNNWETGEGGYEASTDLVNILFGVQDLSPYPYMIAAAGSPGLESDPPPLTLDSLADYYSFGAESWPSAESDYIDARGGSESTYVDDSMRQYSLGHDDIVYGRILYDPDEGKLWLQYWAFYYANSFSEFGYGIHEGDWEMVQVGLNDSLVPDAMTFAAHDTAYGCTWPQTEHPGAGGNSPIVYVGLKSHASYPHGGTTDLPFTAVDRHFGNGSTRTIALDSIGSEDSWTSWHGRWGASTGGDFQSPPNPSEQGDKWSRPSRFHTDHLNSAKCTA